MPKPPKKPVRRKVIRRPGRVTEIREPKVTRVIREHVIEYLTKIIEGKRIEHIELPTEVIVRHLTREGARAFKRVIREEASEKDLERLRAEIERIKREAGAQK